MKTFNLFSASLLVLALASCSKSSIEKGTPQTSDIGASDGPQTTNSGVITAAEWNDLQNWTFWNDVLNKNGNSKMQSTWGFYTNNRFSVKLSSTDSKALCDVPVDLLQDGQIVFSTRTDNKGQAELWANLTVSSALVDASKFQISINKGFKTISEIKPYSQGVNDISIESTWQNDNTTNVCFVIDATSSMVDELKYLKNELYDVISRIKTDNPQSNVLTSAVFYKDTDDDYLTKKSDFNSNGSQTTSFIKAEEANGGGDFPEAVHSALDVAVNNLSWSAKAKSRIIFLVLDAPAHNKTSVISSLQKSILQANSKGIKLIPIIASGADKDTEFSMRLMAMSTNGTFVFITDDSKKGNTHYVPSVGSYQVEFLNNLMVRLVNANLK